MLVLFGASPLPARRRDRAFKELPCAVRKTSSASQQPGNNPTFFPKNRPREKIKDRRTN